MSSVHLAISEIKRFLESPDPEVLCISGEWGVGKTFTWEKLLGEASQTKAIAMKRYAYVSLFGQNSLEALKQSLFENTEFLVDSEDEFKAQAKGIANTALGGIKKGRNLLAAIPYVGQSLEKVISASNGALFATVCGQLICIDDIERRGNGLRVKDVLGLISFMKEQRRCKIVILLNDKELQDEESDFNDQKEKVIDSFIRFKPDAKDSCSIALDSTEEISRLIAGRCIQLGIANIRIISRIRRLASMLEPSLQTTLPEIRNQAIQNIVLLAWCHLDRKKAPAISFVRSGGNNRLFTDSESKPLTEQEARWNSILRDYKFGHMDELDEQLQSGIENGFFNLQAITQIVEDKKAESDRGEGERQLWKAWDLIKHTFEDNTNEVVKAMHNAVKAGGNISLGNMNSTIAFVRSLGHESDADQMIQLVIAQNRPPEYWDIRNNPFAGEISDEKFRSAVEAKSTDTKIEAPLEDIIMRIGDRNGWKNEDIESLAAANPDEVESLLRHKKEENFDKILFGLLTFLQVSNPTPEMKAVNEIAKAVLERFAKESTINAIRVRGYLKGAS